MRSIGLALTLLAFWLLLSGHYTPLLIGFGVLTIGLSIFVALRMKVLDEEGVPIHLLPGALTYFPWLLIEIVKSAWSVTRIVLNYKLPISPELVTLRASQKTPLGVNTYGNSITLTPGTITVKVTTLDDGHELLVHALTRGGAEDLRAGGMDRRVTRFEGAALAMAPVTTSAASVAQTARPGRGSD